MNNNPHTEHTGATVTCDRVVTAATDTFEVCLSNWDPYAGAVGFGLLEMDSWRTQMHHDVNLAATNGHPMWVLDVHQSIHTPSGEVHLATARRYTGGPLEPEGTEGLLVLDEHGLRPAEDGPVLNASSDVGYSDLGNIPDDFWPAAS